MRDRAQIMRQQIIPTIILQLVTCNCGYAALTTATPCPCPANHKKRTAFQQSFFVKSGNVLLSRVVSNRVPSTMRSLTTVFGMGTGGSFSLLPPEWLNVRTFTTAQYRHKKNSYLLSYIVYSD